MSELYFMEYMMENIAIFSPVFSILNILTVIFVILYMHYTAKYKNYELSVAWHILGLFFPLPIAIVFAIKSKKFRHENTKVCIQCGDKYPETFTMCSRCLIELPEVNDPQRIKNKKIGKLFGALFGVVTMVTVIAMTALVALVFYQAMELMEMDCSNRIAVETVAGERLYYDKKGNVYSEPDEVLLYGRNGEVYTFVDTENEDKYVGVYEDNFYIDQDGNEYELYNCYVDEKGYFYYDEEMEICWDDSDYDYEEEEKFDLEDCGEWFDEDTYRYYQDRYYDEEGNLYYYAYEVSWNEKGEIITVENDPTPPIVVED